MLLLFACFMQKAKAQSRYIVKFTNKAFQTTTLSAPASYLSTRCIERRQRYNIPIDSTDLPVTPRYLDSLRNIPTVTILSVSKWLNQVAIQTTDASAIAKMRSYSFVQKVNTIAARVTDRTTPPKEKWETSTPITLSRITGTNSYYSYGSSTAQVNIHNGSFLHDIGLRGQGLIIGMLDGGFYLYTSLKAFDSVNKNGQVLDTYDFVQQESSVTEDHPHGMQCFSIIAANIPGQFVGTAPKANFLLYRSEDAASEYPIEEHNWVCAAERVDSAGGDVISSSLGYTTFDNTTFNHTYADLNGNATMAAIGADLAAKKGLLVLIAAGNEGNDMWKYISTPADADSVLAVGAVNSAGIVGSFSGYGPSSDGQVKPDIASVGVGTVHQAANNTISFGNGTSYACPNFAGLATCLWQGFPEFNNMQIIDAIKRSSSSYSTPNDRIGYGIPDMKKAVQLLLKVISTNSVQLAGCAPMISWTSKDITGMRYEIERKAPGENDFAKIGVQLAKGPNFSSQSYQFQDPLPLTQAGSVSYRIRQVIDTTSAGFSAVYLDTVNVSINSLCTAGQIIMVPNPVKDQLSIQVTIPEALDLDIHISNSLGQVMKRLSYQKPTGSVSIPVFMADLASGKYFVTVYSSGKKLKVQEILRLP
ncbi:S8 family serine peptidase [Flavisolibacter tropicus]|uniref:S8 family serine peptidase n=1 Tax=Flavisolibacter tropicus TaxID=1492898 RepID=UPI00082BC40E|nr:S8 family serine peptidase [Flavisolibacter tropicus]